MIVRETGSDRAAAVASGSVRDAFRRILGDRDLRWLYLTSVLGGGGRGLGVVNLFVLIYLTRVIGLGQSLVALMYGALIVFSVPTPLVAGWLSDRVGRKPLIITVYIGGAIGFVLFLLAGSSLVGLWVGIVVMGIFSFAESPQLQALLADIAPPSIRDASFAVYFTLAFGVGSLWVAVYGAIIGSAGEAAGLPIAFMLMAVTFLLAAVHGADPGRQPRPPERGPRGDARRAVGRLAAPSSPLGTRSITARASPRPDGTIPRDPAHRRVGGQPSGDRPWRPTTDRPTNPRSPARADDRTPARPLPPRLVRDAGPTARNEAPARRPGGRLRLGLDHVRLADRTRCPAGDHAALATPRLTGADHPGGGQ